jgi:hypothetical protein
MRNSVASRRPHGLEPTMLDTPFRFEPSLTPEEYQKIGRLSLKWSTIEHICGNCLKTMLRLTDEEAVIIVFSLSLDQRIRRMKELAKISNLNQEASIALDELDWIMKGLQSVRNNVAHAIVTESDQGEHSFHLRSKQRTYTEAEVFSTEEITNYAAYAVLALRYALGLKDQPGARLPLPERPAIPEFLRELIPTRNKSNQPQ